MLLCFSLSAQDVSVVDLPEDVSLHFISPEPVRYVDISVESISGDLPLKNVLRIKRNRDSVAGGMTSDGIVTIAGETFIAQYKVRYVPHVAGREYVSRIEVLPEMMRPLDPGLVLSRMQLEKMAVAMTFKRPRRDIAHASAFGIEGNVSGLATFGDYVFLELRYRNTTNLKYDTDEIRFKIEDQKVTKATTVQSVEIKPEFVLFGHPAFKRNYRNVFVFKKFSFPGNKVLKIELNEKQISGRVIGLKLKYGDVLGADSL